MERLKGELTKKDEELIRKDDEKVWEREALTNDVANSFMAGFEDAVAQASGIYPQMDFSQLGLGKTVVDGGLVDKEEQSVESSCYQLPFAALWTISQTFCIY